MSRAEWIVPVMAKNRALNLSFQIMECAHMGLSLRRSAVVCRAVIADAVDNLTMRIDYKDIKIEPRARYLSALEEVIVRCFFAWEWITKEPEGFLRFEKLIAQERERQDIQWGGQAHDDWHTPAEWQRFLDIHTRRLTGDNDTQVRDYLSRLVKVAALAAAAHESFHRLQAMGIYS